MHWLYLLFVWIHILAATIWVGGMAFLVLVVVPWLRRGDRAQAAAVLRATGLRFRTIGWICFGLLLTTGTYNAYFRGVRFESFVNPEFLASSFGRALTAKLLLFAVVVAISADHDFSIGPRASEAVARDPASPEAERLRKQASLLGRANALLALALYGAAVVLVRGC